jgi:hypothetical protein
MIENRHNRPSDFVPLAIDERRNPLGACPHLAGQRCSDKGLLAISLGDYLQLLDWTARQTAPGKAASSLRSTACS